MNKTKKWLALGFSFLSVSVLVACGNSEKSSKSSSNEVKTEQSSTKETKTEESSEKKSTYSVGDKIVFEKFAEYTITNVEWSDERNEFDDTNPDKVLKVTYNVKNLSDKDMPVGIEIMPMSIPWVQLHRVDQWKELLNILELKVKGI